MAEQKSVTEALQTRSKTDKPGAMTLVRDTEIKRVLERSASAWQAIVPAGTNLQTLVAIAQREIASNPDLQDCTAWSVLGAVGSAMKLGLRLGKDLQHCAIVAYRDKPLSDKTGAPVSVAQFQVMYKGLIKLARQWGDLHEIDCEVIHANDTFDFDRFSGHVRHTWMLGEDRGAPIGAWVQATYRVDGRLEKGKPIVIDIADIWRARSRSMTWSADQKWGKARSPWTTDEDAMIRKTAVRQWAKLADVTPEFAEALALDGTVRQTPEAEPVQVEGTVIDGEIIDQETGEVTTN